MSGPLDDAERAELERLRAQAAQMSGGVTVTRNVPPKEAVVNEGQEVVYAGEHYGPGDTILHGEGPVINDLALRGIVTITNHDATKLWNGSQGEAIRKSALSHIDGHIEAQGLAARQHDHGFRKYQHGDSHGQEVDVTTHRQRLGEFHQATGQQMTAGQETSNPDEAAEGGEKA